MSPISPRQPGPTCTLFAQAVVVQPEPKCALFVQAVNLVEALKARGLSEQAACAYLDSGPVLYFKAW